MVGVIGGSDTFALGGSTNSSFDTAQIGTQYQNFTAFNKTGTSVWTLTGTPGQATPWLISDGTLKAGAATNVFGATSAITVNTPGLLDLAGNNQQIGALSGSGTVTNSGGAGATLTTGDATNSSFSGVIEDGASQTALTKQGTGIFTLTGTNTYTGGTTINGGMLQLGNGGATGSILGNVTDNGTLAFNRSDSVTFGGVISGTGSVNQIGTGTTILTANSTYTGGTTISAGTLQLGNGGTTGGILGNVTDNGTLAFNRSDSVTLGGVISGTGSVSQIGTGTTILTANSSYTGGTTISAGTLQIGNGGTTGGIAGNVANSGVLAFNRSDASTFGGTISGTGSVSQIGTGTTILTANSTYTGGTTISAGTLQLGNGGTTGGILGNVTDNGTLAFNRSDSVTLGGVISGTGSVSQIGTGTTILTADSSYTGGTTISAGTLQIGNGGASGSILGNVTDNGTLAFNRSDSVTFGGVISGTGSVNQIGTGTTILTADSTYTGGTTISAGTLQLGNGGTTGGILGNVTDNGTLAFNRSDSVTFGGVISGTGSVSQIGTGTTILTANSTYTGGTTISAGTLQIGNGGASGSITGNVINNGVFAIDRSDSLLLTNVISGTGSFQQNGTGTTVLSGNNPYSGPTSINNGTLIVDGSIASSSLTTVSSGARLAGSGTVGSTVISNGGTFAPGPGGAPGTMTVAGNLAFQSGALYVVQVNPLTASTISVTGNGTLAGTVQANFLPGSFVQRNYTILSAAGGRVGTFDALTTVGLPANFQTSLSYTGNTAVLNLTAQLVPPPIPPTPPTPPGAPTPAMPPTQALPPPPVFTVNQLNVGNAIDDFFNNGGRLPASFVPLFGLTGSNLTNALSQLSGEAASGAQRVGFQLTDQFLNLMLDPFVDGRSGVGGADHPALGFAPERDSTPPEIALAYASVFKAPQKALPPVYEPRWTAWGGAYGGSNRASGDQAVIGSHDVSARTVGVAGGLDYRLTPDTVVGLAFAGGGTDWSLSQGLGGGKSDAFQAGVYGATRSGPAYLAAAFAFTNHWMSTDRFSFAGDHLTAKFNAQSIGGRLEGGYRLGWMFGGITPYAAIQAQSFRTPDYNETDVNGGGFGLGFAGRTATDTRSEIGARFDNQILLYPGAVLALRARLAWAHDWVTDPVLGAVFQTLPGAGFIVNGATPAQNSALASAGAELRLTNGISLLGKFDGEFASNSTTYGGTGTIRYRW